MCPFAEVTPPPVAANPDSPALWFWAFLATAVIEFEIWALGTHHSTLSQALKHLMTGKGWLSWLGAALFALLGIHLFFGGPLWTQ